MYTIYIDDLLYDFYQFIGSKLCVVDVTISDHRAEPEAERIMSLVPIGQCHLAVTVLKVFRKHVTRQLFNVLCFFSAPMICRGLLLQNLVTSQQLTLMLKKLKRAVGLHCTMEAGVYGVAAHR